MGQSKKALKKAIKSPVIEGDGYTSPAMGSGDPRHRRGPQRASAFGLRYEPSQFEVDDEFRVRLKDGGVTTKILNKHNDSGGTVVIPAETRRTPVMFVEDSNISFRDWSAGDLGIIGRTPEWSNLTETAYFWCVLPPDGDLAGTWTLNTVWVKGIDGFDTVTVDWEVFIPGAGDFIDETSGGSGSIDETIQFVIDGTSAGEGDVLATESGTFTPVSGEWATFRVRVTAFTGGASLSICLLSAWLEYTTEAATISVT